MCDYAHSRVSAASRARCGFNVGRLIFRRAPKTLLHLLHLLQLERRHHRHRKGSYTARMGGHEEF